MQVTNGLVLQPGRFLRAQDLLGIGLLGSLAVIGPDRSEFTIATILAILVVQLIESKVAFFATERGGAIAFLIKLALCYVLMGMTDGIQSEYFWILLLPVISAGVTLSLLSTTIAAVLASGAYLSFIPFLRPTQYLDEESLREILLRIVVLIVVGYLCHQLAASSREQSRKYQAAAEELAEANRNLREAEAAVRRSERLAALGQMSAGLAHELRNPLGTIKTSAEMLTKSVEHSNALAREMASFISSEVDRTDSLIKRFLDFARPLALRPAVTDLHDVLDHAVRDLEQHRPPFEVVVYRNYSPDIRPFPLDGELMERVFYNLLLNAAQASPPDAAITVKTRCIEDMAEISIIDRGSGIDPKHLENIFNPFFTTKSAGVGLGLAIVSKIVDEHGGKITVESEPGAGSIFRVYLPLKAG